MGYYPRIFFPGLYNAKERFLKKFETVYYLKALPGGWIFRKAPEDWQVIVARGAGRSAHRAVLKIPLSPEKPSSASRTRKRGK